MEEVFLLVCVPSDYVVHSSDASNAFFDRYCMIYGGYSSLDLAVSYKTRYEVFLPKDLKLVVFHLPIISDL